MDQLNDFISGGRLLVDDELKSLLPMVDEPPQRLHSALHWSIFAGGKRFRPILMLAVGSVFDVDAKKILPIAAAIEMIHTYSLIHDDLPAMDNDDLRRGRETCHKKFDEATAILAGDVLQTLAFKTIADNALLSAETRVRLISMIADSAGTPRGMVAGQQMDIDAEGQVLNESQLENIHRGKTGALIRASSVAAAIIAESSSEIINIVGKFAEDLGLLFQVTDDLLDIKQTTEELGKTAGKDVTAQKATYPSIHGIAKSEELADKLVNSACSKLEMINADTSILELMVKYIRERNS